MAEEAVANFRTLHGAWPEREPAHWARSIWRVANRNSIADGVKFGVAAQVSAPVRDLWLPFLAQFAAANGLPEPSVDLVMKPLNQYMVLNLPVVERVRLLRMHYSLLPEVASRWVISRIWSDDSFEVGTIFGKTRSYSLRLCATPVLLTRKEGEVTIALCQHGSDHVLAKLTYLLARSEHGRVSMMIGGIQGPRLATGRQVIVSATRDLYGLRPRDAVLLAASAIARNVNASEIWAVSNSMHVHNARDRRQRKRWFIDYDAFWVERGAQRHCPFGWSMSVPDGPTLTGTNTGGRKRDALKRDIWHLAQSALLGPAEQIAVENQMVVVCRSNRKYVQSSEVTSA